MGTRGPWANRKLTVSEDDAGRWGQTTGRRHHQAFEQWSRHLSLPEQAEGRMLGQIWQVIQLQGE